jgi:hypothetical protein
MHRHALFIGLFSELIAAGLALAGCGGGSSSTDTGGGSAAKTTST